MPLCLVQLAWSYKGQVIHRNDMSLILYGFVQDKQPQLLCAQDRADFNESTPFRSTPPNDDMGARRAARGRRPRPPPALAWGRGVPRCGHSPQPLGCGSYAA